jgi:uncharacterized protein involved in exopolysaccharide biosynthesis
MKAATYSDTHPDMKALKEKIAALDKLIGGKPAEVAATNEVGLDALDRQHLSTKKDLEGISQKLAAARLGESLERGQHSERLSVIEQPTLPQNPVRPDRPKLIAKVFALAIAVAGGLVFALEMLDGTIRRNADVARLFNSQMIVSIPYITTKAEAIRDKSRRIIVAIGIALILALGALGGIVYLLHKYGLF